MAAVAFRWRHALAPAVGPPAHTRPVPQSGGGAATALAETLTPPANNKAPAKTQRTVAVVIVTGIVPSSAWRIKLGLGRAHPRIDASGGRLSDARGPSTPEIRYPTRQYTFALRGVREALPSKPMKTTKKARKLSVTLVVRTGVRAGKRALRTA